MSSRPPSGPPYAPRTAQIGGIPRVSVDVPICAVLLVFYISFAAFNMTIFQKNRRRNYKFIPTVLTFGFCMARIATLTLRIAWSTRQHNVRLAVAANVFVNAGILIIYVINLIFAQRILKAEHPKLGWHPAMKIISTVFYVGIGCALAIVITSAALSVNTLNMSTLKACRDMQLAAITYLLVFVTLPLVVLAISVIVPKPAIVEHFGEGSLLKKKLVVLTVALLCVLLAGFKTGTAWETPRPINKPAWFDSKYAFYFFNFGIEIVILTVLALAKPYKLFYVPDGSKGPGDYTRLLHSSRGSELEVEESKA